MLDEALGRSSDTDIWSAADQLDLAVCADLWLNDMVFLGDRLLA